MKDKKKNALLVALFVGSLCQPVWAASGDLTQTRPGDVYNQDATLRQKAASQDRNSPIENKMQQPREGKTEQGGNIKFTLNKLTVDPSEILSKDEINAVIAQYEGREVTLKEVNEAVAEINRLYAEKQNFIAKAVLLPQKIQNGVLHISLVESHVGKYRIEGNNYIDDSYFSNRMKIKAGDILRLDQLEQDIIRFNKTNNVQLRAVLAKGEKFGTTDVILKTVEPPREQTMLFSDNAGSEATGLYRFGTAYSVNSLHGNGDSLSMNVVYAKGATGGGISYQMPIDFSGTQLGFSYSKNQTNIISGIFKSLQLKGDTTDASISVNHPLRTTLDYKQSGYFELHRKTTDTSSSGQKLIQNSVKSVVFGLAEQKYYPRGMRYDRFDITTGYGYTGGGTFNSSRNAFTKMNFSYADRIMLKNNTAFLLRASGQCSTQPKRALPSTEQFSLGGFSTVRGFKEGDLQGDKGYFISGEYHFPVGKTEGVLFIDHGGVFTYDSSVGNTPNNRDCYMTSMGTGMIVNLAKNTALQVFWGIPVDIGIPKGEKANGSRWHFYFQQQL